MKFHLTEEQDLIQETFDRALADVIGDRRFVIADAATDHDPAVWQAMAELGIAGIMVAEEQGGSGLSLLDAALIAEMLGKHAVPGPFFGHILATTAVARSGDAALIETWLPALLTGDKIGAVAFADEWAPALWRASAAGGTIEGRFDYVPGAQHADLILVAAAGPQLVAVEKAAAGVTIEPVESSDLTRRGATLVLAGAVATPVGDAALAEATYAAGLVLLAADALGGSEMLLELAVAYAKERKQFGVPIGQFQALKHQLANMALAIEPARALVWYAAYAQDSDQPDKAVAAAQAKAHLADRYTEVARAAIQAHGGIGYTWELGLHLWLRRSFLDHAYLGSPAFQRERALQAAGL